MTGVLRNKESFYEINRQSNQRMQLSLAADRLFTSASTLCHRS